jgi:hypothetical protein
LFLMHDGPRPHSAARLNHFWRIVVWCRSASHLIYLTTCQPTFVP